MIRQHLRTAYARLVGHHVVTPAELGASTERVSALCRRAAHWAWLNDAAANRREAMLSPKGWERSAYLHSAHNALAYARQTRFLDVPEDCQRAVEVDRTEDVEG